jgi:hypothetical protein
MAERRAIGPICCEKNREAGHDGSARGVGEILWMTTPGALLSRARKAQIAGILNAEEGRGGILSVEGTSGMVTREAVKILFINTTLNETSQKRRRTNERP